LGRNNIEQRVASAIEHIAKIVAQLIIHGVPGVVTKSIQTPAPVILPKDSSKVGEIGCSAQGVARYAEFAYEDLTFIPGLLMNYRPSDYDVTVTCSYPFTNWALRRPELRKRRPPHVFSPFRIAGTGSSDARPIRTLGERATARGLSG